MSGNIVWADIARDVVSVRGGDAGAFLHSQLAQDIATLEVGQSTHSLLLEPTGHIVALLRVVRHEEYHYTLDVDA
ncbi:MAG: Aminomethyltransferase folate-binding domain, partial [Actinomycetota bacterium]